MELIQNVLTIDWEEWFQTDSITSTIGNGNWDKCESRIERQTYFILSELDKYNSFATFFVVGCLAKKYPQLVRKISLAGHEIGFHGMFHKRIDQMTREEFRQDLIEGEKIVSDIIGKEVCGFRAPSWSVNPKKTPWYYDVLKEHFAYDSSDIFGLFPNQGIRQIPPSSLRFFQIHIPYSGGIFFRLFPFRLIVQLIKFLNSCSKNAMFYFHPWEFDLDVPRLDLSMKKKIIHYYGKKSLKQKFSYLLAMFNFNSIEQVHFKKGFEVKDSNEDDSSVRK